MAKCQNNSSLESIEVCHGLTQMEKAEVLSILQVYKQVFSSKPERTYVMTHKIITVGPQPVPSQDYHTMGKVQEQTLHRNTVCAANEGD